MTGTEGLRAGDPAWGDVRSRTVEWHDPARVLAAGIAMSGIEYLQAMVDGRIPRPPFADLMQIHPIDITHGRVVFTCTPDESMYSAVKLIHGGVVCTLLDTVAGCAVLSTLAGDKSMVSLEMQVSFMRAVRLSSGLLTATGQVVKPRRDVSFREVCFAAGTISDASGAVVATTSSTFLVFDS